MQWFLPSISKTRLTFCTKTRGCVFFQSAMWLLWLSLNIEKVVVLKCTIEWSKELFLSNFSKELRFSSFHFISSRLSTFNLTWIAKKKWDRSKENQPRTAYFPLFDMLIILWSVDSAKMQIDITFNFYFVLLLRFFCACPSPFLYDYSTNGLISRLLNRCCRVNFNIIDSIQSAYIYVTILFSLCHSFITYIQIQSRDFGRKRERRRLQKSRIKILLLQFSLLFFNVNLLFSCVCSKLSDRSLCFGICLMCMCSYISLHRKRYLYICFLCVC